MENEAFFFALSSTVTRINLWMRQVAERARIDHLGYKCGSSEEFERMRSFLETAEWSHGLWQSIISGRRIAVVRLRKPPLTVGGHIQYLELSDQKPDGSQVAGFDHFEIVPRGWTARGLADQLTAEGTTFAPSGRAHHPTFDAVLDPLVYDGLKVRIEDEPLIEKIFRDEMR